MKRELPVYNIEGTDFIVDVANLQLREKANPENTIHLYDMRDMGDGYQFLYNYELKNLPILPFPRNETDQTTVKIPELVKLDPLGMAEKYGYPLESIQNKRDIDIMVDQETLSQRLSGRLPTVDIMGHIFYVDMMMGMLRPKGDFISKGIVFNQIQDYSHYDGGYYTIPYNPKTHEYQEVDNEHITSIPRDLVAVSFPLESIMDRVGFNRVNGLEETSGLKETNVRSHLKAKVIDWKDTGIEQVIRENIKNQKVRKQDLIQIKDDKPSRRQRKGPSL